MFSFELNNEELSYNLDRSENINLHLFEVFKGKKYEIEELNRIKEMEIRANCLKENNASNSTLTFHDTKKFLFETINLGKTESNTKIFLNIKRNRDKKNNEKNKDKILVKESLKEKNDINIKTKLNRGRRKKDAEYNTQPIHDKFSEDNLIQKIKTFIFDYILENLNKSLKYAMNKFYPLSKKINSNLKKNFNEELLNRTIYDIYMNSDVNNRYINIPDVNRNLIKKIYEEKVEIDTINILEKKFKDVLNYIREKDLDNFMNKFRLRIMKKDDKLIDSYMKAIEKMLFKYEIHFQTKFGRNLKKK